MFKNFTLQKYNFCSLQNFFSNRFAEKVCKARKEKPFVILWNSK